MNFRVFPATLTPDRQKVPLIKGWNEQATNDPEQIKLWTDLFRDRLTFWGIPCGAKNGIIALDIDVKKGNGWESLKKMGRTLPPTLYQTTPTGGAHLIFKAPPGIQIPNTVNQKLGLDTRGDRGWIAFYGFKNPGTPIAEAPPWLLEEVAKTPQIAPAGPSIKVVPEIAERLIQASLEAIRHAPEGESNNTLNVESFKLGQLIASGSITREYAEAALFRAAKERGKPDYEAKATIDSGLRGGMGKPLVSPFGDQPPVASFPLPPPPSAPLPPARYTPSFFTREDLLNTSKLKKPQLFEHWSAEDISITTADGGTGKTTLKLYEAICLALGERFLGFNCVQPGKTLFITGEDTDKKLAAMLGQIVRQMGFFESPIYNDKIQTILNSIVVKKDSDLCLIVKDRLGFIHPNGDAFRKVLEAVEDIKPKMIVFDPISSFWGSESALNDMNRAVTKFMSELVEQSHACAEMINHMGKVSSSNKDMSQFAGRGGTGLPSNSRISRVLRPVFEDEYLELTGENLSDRQSAMMCNVNKFSDGSPLYNKPFLILRDGFLFSRKNLSDVKAREAEKQLSDMERVFAFVKEARSIDRYPSEKVVIAHFMNCGNPISEAKVKRALNLLVYQGHMGEMLKLVENPDQSQKGQVYVITDMNGQEI